MQIGMIGLGRMGANMVRRWIRGGHEVVVSDLNQDTVKKMVSETRLSVRRRSPTWSAS
jgi:6-phosphogluconate dehydrogenase